ncbi:MAG: insulinase family protein [Bacteroidales bacterium]|nr:insulinase family protein [Bacteroidales bacterium]
MKRTTKIAAFAIALLLPTSAIAQNNQQIPLDPQVRYGKLENGLTYYIRHNEKPRERVNFSIVQRVGSLQEDENQRGLAHFLEHMCFNGTRHFPGNSVIDYCKSIGLGYGSDLTAYTFYNQTIYNINNVPVASGHIDSCLLILRDWSDGLLLEPEEIDKERGVIHEEWRMRTNAQLRILERNAETLFSGSRYGRRMPLGLMSVVGNFEHQALRDYYEKWYRPDLQAVIVVGDIDVDDIERRIVDRFSDIKMPENPAQFEYYEVPDNYEPIYVLDSDKEIEAPSISIIFKMKNLPRERRSTVQCYVDGYIHNVTCNALNDRLEKIRTTADCPFLSATCYYQFYMNANTCDCIDVEIVAKKGRGKEAVGVVMAEIERARRFGFVATEFERARVQFMEAHKNVFDNRDKMKNNYHESRLTYLFLNNVANPGFNIEWQIYNDCYSQIPIQAFPLANGFTASIDTNFVVFGRFATDDAIPTIDEIKKTIADTRTMELAPYKEESLGSLVLPPKGSITNEVAVDYGYTMLELSNGARVFYKKTDLDNSEILFNAVSHGGLHAIDKEHTKAWKATYNRLYNTCMEYLNGYFSIPTVDMSYKNNQFNINMEIRPHTDWIGSSVSPNYLRSLFEGVHINMTIPFLNEGKYRAAIDAYHAVLINSSNNPISAFVDSAYATITNHNQLFAKYTSDDLDSMTMEDFNDLYKQHFQQAGDFDFFFTGNFDVDSLRHYSELYIASLPSNIEKREAASTTENLELFRGNIMNRYKCKMENSQAILLQYWHGSNAFSTKNNLAASIISNVLTNRYKKMIREEARIVYDIVAYAHLHEFPTETYNLQILAPFEASKCDTLLALIAAEIDDIAMNGITDEELAMAKKQEENENSIEKGCNSCSHENIQYDTLWQPKPRESRNEILKNFTSDDVKNLVAKMKADGNCATIIMLPEES